MISKNYDIYWTYDFWWLFNDIWFRNWAPQTEHVWCISVVVINDRGWVRVYVDETDIGTMFEDVSEMEEEEVCWSIASSISELCLSICSFNSLVVANSWLQLEQIKRILADPPTTWLPIDEFGRAPAHVWPLFGPLTMGV